MAKIPWGMSDFGAAVWRLMDEHPLRWTFDKFHAVYNSSDGEPAMSIWIGKGFTFYKPEVPAMPFTWVDKVILWRKINTVAALKLLHRAGVGQ